MRDQLLTGPQRRELMRVRDTGHSYGRAGYNLRLKGFTEFVWKLSNGRIVGDSEVDPQGWYDQMQGARFVGERITPDGTALLTIGEL